VTEGGDKGGVGLTKMRGGGVGRDGGCGGISPPQPPIREKERAVGDDTWGGTIYSLGE